MIVATYTGLGFQPFNPDLSTINIEDISHALARIGRYGSHTIRHLSVAEHSVVVSLLVEPEYARQALLHDATEAYIGDIVRPLKRLPMMLAYLELEQRLQSAIYQRFGVDVSATSTAAVQAVDDRIIVDEQQLLRYQDEKFDREGFGVNLPGLDYASARELFTARFAELFPEQLR